MCDLVCPRFSQCASGANKGVLMWDWYFCHLLYFLLFLSILYISTYILTYMFRFTLCVRSCLERKIKTIYYLVMFDFCSQLFQLKFFIFKQREIYFIHIIFYRDYNTVRYIVKKSPRIKPSWRDPIARPPGLKNQDLLLRIVTNSL